MIQPQALALNLGYEPNIAGDRRSLFLKVFLQLVLHITTDFIDTFIKAKYGLRNAAFDEWMQSLNIIFRVGMFYGIGISLSSSGASLDTQHLSRANILTRANV